MLDKYINDIDNETWHIRETTSYNIKHKYRKVNGVITRGKEKGVTQWNWYNQRQWLPSTNIQWHQQFSILFAFHLFKSSVRDINRSFVWYEFMCWVGLVFNEYEVWIKMEHITFYLVWQFFNFCIWLIIYQKIAKPWVIEQTTNCCLFSAFSNCCQSMFQSYSDILGWVKKILTVPPGIHRNK